MISDREKTAMAFRFLMNPRSDYELKQEILERLRASPDRRSFRIAEYMADLDRDEDIKKIILMMMLISPEQLRELNRLVNG